MKDVAVSFILKGSDRGTDLVRAGDFVVFLQRLIACLSAVDEAINGESAHYLRIRDLSVASAAATLEPVVQDSKWGMRHVFRPLAPPFAELISAAQQHGKPPSWATVDVLQKTRELCETPKRISSAELIAEDVRVCVDDDFRRAVDEFIGGEVRSIGTITGRLDGVNVHATRLAYLYPGDGSSIACEFTEEATPSVLAALEKRVRITGVITRRLNSNRPVRVRILDIEVLAENSELPLFASLIGASPGATGGLSSEDYLSQLREGDD